MHIAQVAPLFESVPPKNYGGTERVVSYLTEELVRRGETVTLFASGDSKTQARLIRGSRQSLRTDPDCPDQLALHFAMLENVLRHEDEFDLIHFHVDYLHLPFTRRLNVPHLATLHGRLDIAELPPLYREYDEAPVISISNDQRRPLPEANWQETVYHGLPEKLHTFRPEHGKYLAFLGRMSEEKRPDRAVELAEQTGMKLKIVAKVDKNDLEYYEGIKDKVEGSKHVEFLGELGGAAKDSFLGNAYALLFPIDWPEPFGLVMIEALACGTPVVAWRNGSVPEIIEDGVTGFIVDNMKDAAEAVRKVATLNRQHCRQSFLKRFTVSRMASDYLAIYRRMVEAHTRQAANKKAHPDGVQSKRTATANFLAK